MPDRPNILLVVAEDMGPHFGVYGNADALTPQLDRFARENLRFNNAWCAYPVCSPGRASLLTGLPSHENGTFGLATARFTTFAGVPSLPSLLAGEGYRTGLIGKLHVLPEDRFRFDMRWADGNRFGFGGRDYPKMLRYADEFMDDDLSPFFLMVALPDAHVPFLHQTYNDPKDPFEAGDVGVPPGLDQTAPELAAWYADYHNCIRRADSAFGGLLQLLEKHGIADSTLVIFTADHGLQFPRGKLSVYEPGLKIPLLVGGAGVTSPAVVDTPVMQVDAFATILEAAGIPLPAPCRGQSLIPLAADPPNDRFSFADRTACMPQIYFPQRAVRNQRYKLIRSFRAGQEDPYYRMLKDGFNNPVPTTDSSNRPPIPADEHLSPAMRAAYETWRLPPEYQLYDLQEDPLETRNLAGSPELNETEAALRRALENWMVDTDDFILNPDKRKRFEIEIEHFQDNLLQARQLGRTYEWDYVKTSRPRTLA